MVNCISCVLFAEEKTAILPSYQIPSLWQCQCADGILLARVGGGLSASSTTSQCLMQRSVNDTKKGRHTNS